MKGVMKGEKSCKQAKGRVFDNVPKNLNNKASWLNFIFHEILFEKAMTVTPLCYGQFYWYWTIT